MRSIASGALDRVDNPTAWLYRSARNAVIDHYRTRRVHGPLPEPDQWPDPDQPGNEPNEATRELARCLQPLLSELPDTARDALTRVDLNGETHQHVADELGISVSGMKSRVQRARRQLKNLLTECCVRPARSCWGGFEVPPPRRGLRLPLSHALSQRLTVQRSRRGRLT